MISVPTQDDIDTLELIHQKFYMNEFKFNEFTDAHLLQNFVVKDDGGEIVTGVALRAIVEVVGITDKSKSTRARKDALIKILQASTFTAARFGFQQLHVFVQEDEWKKHLLEYGFKTCKGDALVIGV